MPHGSLIERDEDGSVRAWIAPDGTSIASILPDGIRLDLSGVIDKPVTVGGPIEAHPVLGPVQSIRAAQKGADAETVVARVASTDWGRPAHVPAIDAPAHVPAGAGTALLNVLALSGRTLRYAGPYPTAALYASLCECFRPSAPEDEFTAGALERALHGDRSEVPVDLVPAPFERVMVAPRAVVHLRDGVERAYLGGLAWGRGGARRLTRDGDVTRASLWIADEAWAEVAVLSSETGALISGPKPLPHVQSSVIGKRFPPSLLAALVEVIAEDEPPLLVAAMRELVTELPAVWGDPGADVARPIAGVLVVHAALWERLGGGAAPELARHLALALAPSLKQLAQARLETVPIGVTVN